jgi:hypothetical protein
MRFVAVIQPIEQTIKCELRKNRFFSKGLFCQHGRTAFAYQPVSWRDAGRRAADDERVKRAHHRRLQKQHRDSIEAAAPNAVAGRRRDPQNPGERFPVLTTYEMAGVRG